MLDETWLKQLARARLRDGGWVPANPQEAQRLTHEERSRLLADIEEELAAALVVYNRFAPAARQMALVPASSPLGPTSLMLGRSRATLQVREDTLKVQITHVSAFRSYAAFAADFALSASPLGGLRIHDGKAALGRALLVRMLLEELVKVWLSYEASDDHT